MAEPSADERRALAAGRRLLAVDLEPGAPTAPALGTAGAERRTPRAGARAAVRRARASLRRPVARRSGWVVVDQGLSSLTTFAASVVVAREVSGEVFGAFASALLVTIVVVNLGRGLVSQPLAIRVSARHDQRADVAAAAGASVGVGVLAGAPIAVAGLVLGGPVGRALAVAGLFMPVLVLQDSWRFCLFTMARPRQAAAIDLVWAVLAVVLPLAAADAGVGALVAAWAAGAAASALLGLRLVGVVPDLHGGVRFVRRHLALGWRYTVEAAIVTSTTQVSVLVVGVAVGAAGVGAIRGATTLFGPFTVAFLALMAAGIAEGSRLLARDPHRLVPVLVVASAGMAALPCAWGVALLLAPSSWGSQVLGETWAAAHALVVPIMVKTAATGTTSGALIGLRVVAAARATLRLRLVTGVVTLAAGAAGGWLVGVHGAVWGLALGTWATAAGAWWQLARVHRTHPHVFTGGQDRRS
ncbi:MAG: hypothetical protein C0P77_016235 [Thermoanaerobacterales bacterium]|nr:hypothetical protein [Acidimicrobiales bacterium]